MQREFTLKMVVQAVDRATQPFRKVGRAMSEMLQRARLERLAAGIAAAREKLSILGDTARQAGKSLRDIGGVALTRVTAPLALIGGFALNASGKMEQLTLAFESMLGGADAARSMVKELADFAAGTPFQLEGIGGAAKQLLSFGVAQNEVMGQLKILGDIAAGANVPLQDMAAIFGKAKAKGKAMTEELLQLSDRGIPIIDVLAKQMNVPKQAIFDLASKGRISFELLARAMESMTKDGGIFADQMKKQSASLFGLFSTLKDNVIISLGVIGDVMVEVFQLKPGMTSLIEWVQEAISSFKEFAKANPVLTKFGFILAAVAAAAGPALIALGLMASGIGVVATGLAALLSPIGLTILAVAALAGAATWIYTNWGGVAAFFKDLWNDVAAAFDTGFVQGVMQVLETFNPAVWIAKGVDALVKYLFGIDLGQIGRDWIGGLAEGMQVAWQDLIGWLSAAVTGLMDWMPDWVKERLGIDAGGLGGSAAPAAPQVRPAIGPAQSAQVGGAVRVQFENAPTNMRVREVKSDTPGFGIDVDAGYAMAGP